MRQVKVKVKLEGDLYQDWATRIQCCGKDKWFNSNDMEPGNMWNCVDCDRLLMVVSYEGVPYYVGEPVFDRKRT